MMDKVIIGRDAGIIWRLLNSREKWCIADLLRTSGLEESQFYTAIGWLAREDKIVFGQGKNEEHCSIKFDFYF